MSTRAGDAGGRTERGIATVWAVAWMFVCLTVGGIGALLAGAEVSQHHVDGAADLAALSAAARLQRGGDPCPTAAAVSAANQVTLVRCRVDGEDVLVTVRARLDLPFGLHPWVSGEARAGPA